MEIVTEKSALKDRAPQGKLYYIIDKATEHNKARSYYQSVRNGTATIRPILRFTPYKRYAFSSSHTLTAVNVFEALQLHSPNKKLLLVLEDAPLDMEI